MRHAVAALGGFVAGAALGFIYSTAALEGRLQKKYQESEEMRRRAYDLAEKYSETVEEPAGAEEDLVVTIDVTSTEISGKVFTGEGVAYSPLEKNPYHTPPQILTESGVEVELEQILYIAEEDYIEECGRAKTQLTFVGDGTEVHFFEEGVQIDDWKDRLGESFLVDFNKLVPYGAEPIVHVRNVKTDTDYEVIRENP